MPWSRSGGPVLGVVMPGCRGRGVGLGQDAVGDHTNVRQRLHLIQPQPFDGARAVSFVGPGARYTGISQAYRQRIVYRRLSSLG
eukprot:6179297-Pleurochrysis_carterae.AAC.2